MNRIGKKLSEIRENKGKALITFITAGDPNLESTRKFVHTLEMAGADIIELGVPYSDPLADGPVIQEASQRALKAGTTLAKVLETVKDIRKKSNVPLILMTYYNPLLKYGLASLAKDSAEAGIDGFIVPDLPAEESEDFRTQLDCYGLSLIPLVAPTSGPGRIKLVTKDGSGFVYCVSLTGVTGIRTSVPSDLAQFMSQVRKETELPLAVGFGISSPEQAKAVSEYCDAVIVGSALVKTISEAVDYHEAEKNLYYKVKALKEALF